MAIKKEFKIGFFVVVVMIAAFFVINYLRGVDVFNKQKDYYSVYESVDGLSASAPVTINGYNVGKVASVVYNVETKKFDVTCVVDNDFEIPVDSKMTIYSVDIMGGKGVRIDLGTSEEICADGAFLEPAKEQDLIGGLAENIGPVLSKLTVLMDSLNVTVSGVNQVLSDKNQKSIESSLAHLRSTLANVSKLVAYVNTKTGDIDTIVNSLSDFSAQLTNIGDKLDTTLTGVNGFVDDLNKADVEALVASLNKLVSDLNNPEGSVGKLIHDGSVYESLDSVLVGVDSLINKIQRNPKKYLKISVF